MYNKHVTITVRTRNISSLHLLRVLSLVVKNKSTHVSNSEGHARGYLFTQPIFNNKTKKLRIAMLESIVSKRSRCITVRFKSVIIKTLESA